MEKQVGFSLNVMLKYTWAACFMVAVVPGGGKEARADGFWGDVGNGGGAYVCRDPLKPNRITSAETIDLWEGKNPQIHGLNITKTNDISAKEQSKRAIKMIYPAHPYFFELVVKSVNDIWEKIEGAMTRGDTGMYLSVVPDALDIARPKYCPGSWDQRPQYEQVANYVSDSEFRIDTELFMALDTETDRAALVTHEAIYRVLRQMSADRNSRDARAINAYLYAKTLPDVLHEMMKNKLKGGLTPEGVRTNVLDENIKIAIKSGDVRKVSYLLELEIPLYGSKIKSDVIPEMVIFALKQAPGEKVGEIFKLLMEHRKFAFDLRLAEDRESANVLFDLILEKADVATVTSFIESVQAYGCFAVNPELLLRVLTKAPDERLEGVFGWLFERRGKDFDVNKVTRVDGYEHSLASFAIEKRRSAGVLEILRRDPNLDFGLRAGLRMEAPLLAAAMEGCVECVGALVADERILFDSANQIPEALYWAIWRESLPMVRLFFENARDLSVSQYAYGGTILDHLIAAARQSRVASEILNYVLSVADHELSRACDGKAVVAMKNHPPGR